MRRRLELQQESDQRASEALGEGDSVHVDRNSRVALALPQGFHILRYMI